VTTTAEFPAPDALIPELAHPVRDDVDAPGRRPDDDVGAIMLSHQLFAVEPWYLYSPASDRPGASGSGRANGAPPTRRLCPSAPPLSTRGWPRARALRLRGVPPAASRPAGGARTLP